MLQNTYDGMVDVDKGLATYVAGSLLENHQIPLQKIGIIYIAIRKKPLNQFKENIKELGKRREAKRGIRIEQVLLK